MQHVGALSGAQDIPIQTADVSGLTIGKQSSDEARSRVRLTDLQTRPPGQIVKPTERRKVCAGQIACD